MKRMIVACSALALTAIWGVTATANDEQIAQQIIERLQQQRQTAQLQDFNIGVQVEKGTVTMMGNVSSSDHAVLALDIARRIPGVKLVVNDLYVQAPQNVAAGESRDAGPAHRQRCSLRSLGWLRPLRSHPCRHHRFRPVRRWPGFSDIRCPAYRPRLGGARSQPAVRRSRPCNRVGRPSPAKGAAGGPSTRPRRSNPMPCARTPNGSRASLVARNTVARARSRQRIPIGGGPSSVPMMSAGGSGIARLPTDNPQMPGYAWPSYAAYPNYAAVTYPHQYSATAWPYIGPFYPYPQVPLGWRKVMLEWDDGWWFLDFKSK